MTFDPEIFRAAGRAAALALREVAKTLTGTELIDRERDVPDFDPTKDYTGWPVGSPVANEGQVWQLIQPYNAAHYSGRPSTLRALWGIVHTKDPAKAKPWVDAYGTSGMYMLGECYRDDNGVVWRCLQDNTVHPASAYPAAWEAVA